MTTAKTKLMTADDLLRLDSEGIEGDLIRGVLHRINRFGSAIRGTTVVNVGVELYQFVKPRRLGTLLMGRPGVRLERDPDTVLGAKLVYIAAGRLPEDMDTSGYPEVAPDLVVDVSSNKDDDLQMIHEKALMWIGFGVKLVWVAHPDESMRTIDVYRAGGDLTTLSEGDTLDGGDVLPGFTYDVSDIFGI